MPKNSQENIDDMQNQVWGGVQKSVSDFYIFNLEFLSLTGII
jgi:hypothetical protein